MKPSKYTQKVAKYILFLFALVIAFTVALSVPAHASARTTRTYTSDIYVRSYTRKNGTVVRGYYKTPKDSTKKNNFSCLDYGRC